MAGLEAGRTLCGSVTREGFDLEPLEQHTHVSRFIGTFTPSTSGTRVTISRELDVASKVSHVIMWLVTLGFASCLIFVPVLLIPFLLIFGRLNWWLTFGQYRDERERNFLPLLALIECGPRPPADSFKETP